MSKIVGFAVAAVTLVMAIACGGSDSAAPTTSTVSYKGTIDYATIGDNVDGISVVAKLGTTTVATATIDPLLPTGRNTDTDYEYTLEGLTSGTQYTIDVVKADSTGNTIDLLSTVDTATSTTGTLAKPFSGYTTVRQINIYTTLVATEVKKGGSITLASATQAIFGSGISDLSAVVVSNGSVSAGTVPSGAKQLATMLASSVLSAAKLSRAELSSAYTELKATFTAVSAFSISSANLTDANLDFTSITSAVSAAFAKVATVNSTISNAIAADLVRINPDSTFTTAQLGNSASLNTAAQSAVATENAAEKVLKFDVAHATYGAKSTTGFVLNSLAPVFTVEVEGNYSSNIATDLLTMTVTNAAGTKSFTDSTASSLYYAPSGTYSSSSNSTTFYFYVKKASGNTVSLGSELAPGASYNYTLKSTVFKFNGFFSNSGILAVRDVTITYPYSSGLTSVVTLSGNGGVESNSLTAGTPVDFYLHSVSGIKVDSSKDYYGILGASSALSVDLTNATAGSLSVSDVYFTSANVATAAKISLRNVVEGNQTITIKRDQGLMSSNGTEITDYPTTVSISVK